MRPNRLCWYLASVQRHCLSLVKTAHSSSHHRHRICFLCDWLAASVFLNPHGCILFTVGSGEWRNLVIAESWLFHMRQCGLYQTVCCRVPHWDWHMRNYTSKIILQFCLLWQLNTTIYGLARIPLSPHALIWYYINKFWFKWYLATVKISLTLIIWQDFKITHSTSID